MPSWARGKALETALLRQASNPVDPGAIFTGAKTCDLKEIFSEEVKELEKKKGKPVQPFRKRGSSENWTKDQLTSKEEIMYKQQMGYK